MPNSRFDFLRRRSGLLGGLVRAGRLKEIASINLFDLFQQRGVLVLERRPMRGEGKPTGTLDDSSAVLRHRRDGVENRFRPGKLAAELLGGHAGAFRRFAVIFAQPRGEALLGFGQNVGMEK